MSATIYDGPNMKRITIRASGLYTPPESISNDELVAAFNAYVELHNAEHADAIAAGTQAPLSPSSSEFILKASGIRSRHVLNKAGVLDIQRMTPELACRSNDEPSQMCDMGVAAGRQALERAGVSADSVDLVICAASNMQRAYPAMAVEIQDALGASGFAYDMNVACASATFGLQAACDAVRSGAATRALVISPEICSGHLNFRDRDSHFIFGDACTAMLVEPMDEDDQAGGFEILGARLKTQFSSNIRNNAGFLNRAEVPQRPANDLLFIQQGRKVFKEVVPMVSSLIAEHLRALDLQPEQVCRFWLHQANLSMNQLIARKVLGCEPAPNQAPVILDEYANTSSAGSVIAFHLHSADLQVGDIGALCAFGGGYSVGNVILRRH